MNHADLLKDTQLIARAKALLDEMSLDEKIGQMTMGEISTSSPQEAAEHGLGAILAGAGSWPEDSNPYAWLALCDQYWDSYAEQTSTHFMPPLVAVDAIHGHNNVRGGTVFPHNIGIGATQSPSLAYQVANATKREIMATGIDWNLAPNLAVAKDIRWGRTYESFSEDVRKVCKFVEAHVTGYQGKGDIPDLIACAKHWVGDGAAAHGHDQGDAWISWESLNENHIAPFKKAVDAGVLTIMASFCSWNGRKCHGNPFLLQEILRNKLKFKGLVLSDWGGINYLSDDHYLATAMGVNAGIDMFMMPDNWRQFIADLKRHVEMGSVSRQRIDEAVQRILLVKLAYGLPDKPKPSERDASRPDLVGCDSHLSLARQAVRRSQVLLKNENRCLPLKDNNRVAVMGKLANDRGALCGGFTIEWQGTQDNQNIPNGTSIWEAIEARCAQAELFSQGQLPDPKNFDAVIMVLGETPYAEGLGDIRDEDNGLVKIGSQTQGLVNVVAPFSNSLSLERIYPEDSHTLKELKKIGLPVISLFISGRPLITDSELTNSNAFVASWLPGSQGTGVVDMLFGDEVYQGKLAFRWPSSHQDISQFPRGYGLTGKEKRHLTPIFRRFSLRN